ncbi:AraC family transcriptional regulator [Paenibacillus gorillae]|uniref:AraC family transcriptional regulator n=1 Tax=Paenibacillus gorillae TaxID=1243662 RepID=UPI0004AE9BBA|nr:AraC family transcriptional regulator [Paenibacillus gorillae]
MRKSIATNDQGFEERLHGDYRFPFEVSRDSLSEYEQGFFECHWHPEVEFTVVLEGSMLYQVNDTVYELSEGSGLFANANSLHSARAHEDSRDCTYIAVIFNPVLVFGHERSAIEEKYVRTVTEPPHLASMHLTPEIGWQRQMIQLLMEIHEQDEQRGICYELIIKSKLCELWALLYQGFQSSSPRIQPGASRSVLRVKQALQFIHNHYQNKLTLEEIAAACNLSKSECSRFFKKMIRQSPFEYLLHYRIQKSLPLLLDPDANITEVSEQVGFASVSYYAEIFRRYMKCSPTEYRKQHKK